MRIDKKPDTRAHKHTDTATTTGEKRHTRKGNNKNNRFTLLRTLASNGETYFASARGKMKPPIARGSFQHG